MGSDRRSSVVNANCRVHGVDNLFIAGSATFPTSSQANPTLTVVALALRLAEHVQLLLRPMTPVVRTRDAPAVPASAGDIARSLTA